MPTFDGQDIPIVKLKPLHERAIAKREYDRIAASISVAGLLEPLIVYPESDHFLILNGYQRYRILLDMGVETVPCIIWQHREAFTGNRMVNRLTPIQESRMIEKSLEELDEKTIASAFGLSYISHRLKKSLLKQLHPSVAKAYDAGKLTKACVQELTFVTPNRQKAILSTMEGCNDFSTAFARIMILKTPVSQRSQKRNAKRNPWNQKEEKKKDLLKQLKEAEEKHDFYSGLYRQYSINFLKLVVFMRTLVTNDRIEGYLQRCHPDMLMAVNEIIAGAEQ